MTEVDKQRAATWKYGHFTSMQVGLLVALVVVLLALVWPLWLSVLVTLAVVLAAALRHSTGLPVAASLRPASFGRC